MTKTSDYPYHEDFEWIASDRAGRLARFTTGGRGPVPAAFFEHEDANRMVQRLLENHAPECEVEAVALYPDMSDFRRCSQRGLFTYDWSDVHRVQAQYRGVYELITRPTRPVTMDLVRSLSSIADEVVLRMDVLFEEAVDVPVDRWFTWVKA